MTSETTTPESAATLPGEPETSAGPVRRKIVLFVLTFITLVLTLLIGYRYAVGVNANMWYLFRVAQDTSFMLDLLGHESFVESQNYQRGRENWVRHEILRLNGKPVEDFDSKTQQMSGPPLTAWEKWKFRTLSAKSRNVDFQDHGPIVNFWASEDQPFIFRVVPDCGAIPSLSIYIAAVLAFPVAFRKRILGVLLGVPILYGVNIMRLTCLAFIGAWTNGGEVFKFSHEVVWQGVFIIFVVGVWLAWVEFVVRRNPE